MTIHSDSFLEIDLGAIAHNYKYLAKKSGAAETAAVVKANAYGLGVKQVADKLEKSGCKSFFVATLDEALELRSAMKKNSIFVFHGLGKNQEKIFLEKQIIPVLNDIYQIDLWKKFAKKIQKKLPSVLHIDTGMNRLGLSQQEAKKFLADKKNFSSLDIKYLMTHLACANEQSAMNSIQLEDFGAITALQPDIPSSIANSSGIFLGQKFRQDLVRPGSALYGVNPSSSNKNPMKNVVTLTAKIIQIREITGKRETVGYGATKTISAGSRIAIIPVGYADGYLRHLSNSGIVYFDGCELPIIGRVSMDLTIIDITKISPNKIKIGSEIELIGRHVPVDLVAKKAGTIGYEILTNLGSRYNRKYKN
mgnify:CR=1 FL=1